MRRNDKCFCGSGLKVKRCHDKLNENSVVGNLINVYKDIDNIIKSNIDCKCKENCSECCSDYFYISEEEFLTIMEYMIRNFTKEEISEIKLRAMEYMSYIEVNYNNEYKKLNTLISSKEEIDYEKLVTREHNLKKPCVFLKDGKCSIYDARPLICRFYGTMNKKYKCEEVCVKKDISNSDQVDKILIERRINGEFERIIGDTYIDRGYPISDFIVSMYDFNIECGKYKVATERDKKDYIMIKANINK